MSKSTDKNKSEPKTKPSYALAFVAGFAPEVAARMAGLENVPDMTPALESDIATAKAEWDALTEDERIAYRAALDPENQPSQGGPSVDAAAKALADKAEADRKSSESGKPAGAPVYPYRIKGVDAVNVDGNQVRAKDGVFHLTAEQVAGVVAHGLKPESVKR